MEPEVRSASAWGEGADCSLCVVDFEMSWSAKENGKKQFC
uniref:Uncharacterized protein n=1 Tax=Arundo donax TaxID=35708 RepID=A0A0A9CRQ3_ARUDO